ncbi:MAG: hypothetical protein GKR89_18295 [Candidatus Latescibacteria bacterium]|nr:hypothetical protein [Candidatus Latescibacterota bacterium]
MRPTLVYQTVGCPGSIIAAAGWLYCYEERRGTLALVKATPERFAITSSFPIDLGSGQHWAHPVIVDGLLYLRHGDVVMAYDISDKSKRDPTAP